VLNIYQTQETNMSKIEFISHDSFPEDEYTKELVYLCLDGKYRIAYVRKSAKSGGMFWSVATVGATRNGQKEFFPAFLQDSNFLEKDIKDFLDKRKWEGRGGFASQSEKPRSMDEANNDQLPF
jgi:hypothetical protein